METTLETTLTALYECRTFFGDLSPSTFVLGSCGPGTTTRLTPRAHRVERRMWEGPRRRYLAIAASIGRYRPRASDSAVRRFFLEMRLELGHSMIPALHVPLTHLRAEHARGSCGTSAPRASQSFSVNHSEWVYACLAPSPCRSTSRSLQSDGGRAPRAQHGAFRPRGHTCQASPTYMRDVAPRHRSSSHQAVRPVRVAALAGAAI